LSRSFTIICASRIGTQRKSIAIRAICQTVSLLAAIAPAASAQLPQPQLDWLVPAGGQRGTHVDITIGGTDLDESRQLMFSDPRLSACVKHTAADEFYPDGRPVADQFTLDINNEVPPGLYEVQAVGRHGASTIRVFQVGDLLEVAQKNDNHAVQNAQSLPLGSVVNGHTESDADDFYVFELAKGDEVSCEAWARRIDSQADIWIDVCRSDGSPLKTRSRSIHRDPLLKFAAPASGKYFLRVRDALYRGGKSFVYRLAVHNRPSIEYVMPPAAKPNSNVEFKLFGKSLGQTYSQGPAALVDAQSLTLSVSSGTGDGDNGMHPLVAEPRDVGADQFPLRLPQADSSPDETWIGLTSNEVVVEQEPNDSQTHAQVLNIPGELVGQFFPEGDRDWIELRPDVSGEWVLEVFSERYGLPTDPDLLVYRVRKDEQGKESTEEVVDANHNDTGPKMAGYNFTSEDPCLRVNLEKGAVYRALLWDRNSESRADPANVYRFVVRRPQPDFRLVTAPASPWATDPAIPRRWPLNVLAGGSLAIPVVALREDGFANSIVVSAEGLPTGLTCKPSTIGAGKTDTQLVLTADEHASEWTGSIRIVGKGVAGENRIRRFAVPASLVCDSIDAGFERSRLNRQLVIGVLPEQAPVSISCAPNELEASPGGTVTANLAVTIRGELKEAFDASPVGLPRGITSKFTLADDHKSGKLELTIGDKTKPASYDFELTAKPKITYRNNPEGAAHAEKDRERIAAVSKALAEERTALVGQAGAGSDTTSEKIKQLDDRIAHAKDALHAAEEFAKTTSTNARPAERQCYVVSNMVTLRVSGKADP
jgi:hypothetical protein